MVDTLLQNILRRRIERDVTQLKKAFTQLRIDTQGAAFESISKQDRIKLLIGAAGFPSFEVETEIIAKYAAPAVVVDDEEGHDAEFDQLLEDLAEDMACNAADLKAWRGELQQKTLNKLSKSRHAARKAKQTRLNAFRAKKAARKSAKGKVKARPIRVLRRRPNAPRLETPAPAPAGEAPGPAGAVTPSAPAPAEGATAGPPPPPSRPGGGRAQSARKPREGNGWHVCAVGDHGWLRYNADKSQIDAHCGYCAGGCKLDRRANRAPIGLLAAWLERGAHRNGDRDLHTKDKLRLSLSCGFQARQAARDMLNISLDPSVQAALAVEQAARDGDAHEQEEIVIRGYSEADVAEAIGEEMTEFP